MMQVPAMPLERFRQTAAHAEEAGMDLTGLFLVIARRGPGPPNLCRLLISRNARSEHPRSQHARRRSLRVRDAPLRHENFSGMSPQGPARTGSAMLDLQNPPPYLEEKLPGVA